MEIRKATKNDMLSIVRSIQNKHIDYFTSAHAKRDIENGNMYILVIDNKIVCSCSLVNTDFGWLGVKRMCIFNKKNNGKGYAKLMLAEITKQAGEYCITPWEDNHAMRHIVEKVGFEYKYTFNENWCCYLKKV